MTDPGSIVGVRRLKPSYHLYRETLSLSEAKLSTTTVIKPHGSALNLELGDVWAYRELLLFLIWRDVKIRYKQTAIGVFWALLQPALTTVVFAVIFSQVGKFSEGEVPYVIYVLSGLLIWLFIFNAISFSSNSLLVNVNLITKVFFPRLILPVAAVFAGLIDIAIGFVLLLLAMLYYGVTPAGTAVFAPLFILLAVVLTMSLGSLFAALNVRFRDVKFGLPFFLQIWMFASPIFYPSEILPEKVRSLLLMNPLSSILNGFRASLLGQPIQWNEVGVGVAIVVFVMFLSIWVFKKMEDSFADLI
jgi:lipopolysaccharide transport system permease protein